MSNWSSWFTKANLVLGCKVPNELVQVTVTRSQETSCWYKELVRICWRFLRFTVDLLSVVTSIVKSIGDSVPSRYWHCKMYQVSSVPTDPLRLLSNEPVHSVIVWALRRIQCSYLQGFEALSIAASHGHGLMSVWTKWAITRANQSSQNPRNIAQNAWGILLHTCESWNNDNHSNEQDKKNLIL